MYKKMMYLIVSVSIILWLNGCASIDVSTSGFLDQTKGLTGIPKGTTFAVLENDQVPNPIFEKEIRLKIEKLLKKNGYLVTNLDTADYCLVFSYSIDKGTTTTESVPVYSPPQTQNISIYSSRDGYSWGDYTTPGYTSYYPVSVTRFARTLMLKVVNGEVYKKDKKVEILWMADSISSGSGSDLRKVIDYLLVGTFRYFGQDTGGRIDLTLSEDDKEVKELRGQGRIKGMQKID